MKIIEAAKRPIVALAWSLIAAGVLATLILSAMAIDRTSSPLGHAAILAFLVPCWAVTCYYFLVSGKKSGLIMALALSALDLTDIVKFFSSNSNPWLSLTFSISAVGISIAFFRKQRGGACEN